MPPTTLAAKPVASVIPPLITSSVIALRPNGCPVSFASAIKFASVQIRLRPRRHPRIGRCTLPSGNLQARTPMLRGEMPGSAERVEGGPLEGLLALHAWAYRTPARMPFSSAGLGSLAGLIPGRLAYRGCHRRRCARRRSWLAVRPLCGLLPVAAFGWFSQGWAEPLQPP